MTKIISSQLYFSFLFWGDENRKKKKKHENHPKPWRQCPFPGPHISSHISSPGTSSVSPSRTRCAKPLSAFIPSIFLSNLRQFPGARVLISLRSYDQMYLLLSDFITFLSH